MCEYFIIDSRDHLSPIWWWSMVPYHLLCVNGGARGVVVIAVGNEHGDTSSNPGRDFSHSTNTLGKGMNPIILPPAMDK